jgi:hypothetical protein
MHSVNSSHLRAVGYEPATRKLHIQFQNGDTHEYSNVSPDFHQTMMASDSIGSFFHKHIKPLFNSRRIS